MEHHNQLLSLPVTNFDEVLNPISFKRHSPLFGGTCKRMLLIGPSGCGKTNALLSLLLHLNGLRFMNLYICSKSLHQEKYNYLRNLFNTIPEIGYRECSDVKNMTPPSKVYPFSIVVFDDIPSIEQNVVKEYFSFGRHKNVDCLYLSQTYSAIPKQLLRDNCNFLVLFKQDGTNLKHIFNDHVHDMTYGQFENLCQQCWRYPFGMLVIDCDSKFNEGKYRFGFDTFINI